ncbi:MAG: DUF4105 domain-containing protein [Bacteroidales bacterium]|nr:DUF4105 domain-containing protein [Bacteroidales bacterium]
MKKNIVTYFFLLFIGITSIYSNDNIEISLLTCSSGSETFTAWGHSAIRIIDKKSSVDIVYNFGLFDFNTPNFYLKFIKGKLKYKLGTHSTRNFFISYFEENRQIIEQKLNLSEEDKVKIINELGYLYRPENRYYYYSFVGKNCTSELRDLLFENVETDFQNQLTNKTHRDQLNEFLNDKLWVRLGMSLIMGYKVDKKIDMFESMFLPDYLCYGLNNIQTNGEKLVLTENVYNKIENNNINYPFIFNPLFILSLLLLVVLFVKSKFIQTPILLIVGLIGLAILLVSLITEHPELQYNLNLLWLNPLYILAVFKFRKKPKLKIYLAGIIQILIIIIIPIWIFKVQYFELSYLPIILFLTLFNLRIVFPEKRLQLIKSK